MSLAAFLVWSTLGSGIWTALHAGAGYVLKSHCETISDYLNPVSTMVVILILGWYPYRAATFKGASAGAVLWGKGARWRRRGYAFATRVA